VLKNMGRWDLAPIERDLILRLQIIHPAAECKLTLQAPGAEW